MFCVAHNHTHTRLIVYSVCMHVATIQDAACIQIRTMPLILSAKIHVLYYKYVYMY